MRANEAKAKQESGTAALPVVVIGCGRLGSYLVTGLHHDGYAVRVVDRNAEAFSSLPEDLARACFEGDPLDVEVLERAGMAEAHYVVATTSSDELNVAIALVARALFGTKEVIALVRAPERADSFAKLGIRTLCQTTLVATAFRRLIDLDAES